MNEQVNQICPRPSCEGKIVEKEIYKDTSPTDDYKRTYFTILVCDDKDCPMGKGKLEEYEYWKQLAEELKIPDLKYGSLRYDRGSNRFGVLVKDIQEDGVEGGTPKQVWQEAISPEEISKAFGTNKFRELITENLRRMAPRIKKAREEQKHEL